MDLDQVLSSTHAIVDVAQKQQINVDLSVLGNVTKNVLPAKAFFEYERRKVSQSVTIGNEWLLSEVILIDNRRITEEDLDILSCREYGSLLAEIIDSTVTVQCYDDRPFNQTSDFAINGFRFREKEKSGQSFSDYMRLFNSSIIDAYEWAITSEAILLIDEVDDREKLLSELPINGGLGFDGVITLVEWLKGFLGIIKPIDNKLIAPDKVFKKVKLAGIDYFNYEEKKEKEGIIEGNNWLLANTFNLKNEDVQGLKFREYSSLIYHALDADKLIEINDNRPFNRSTDFTICSHRFEEGKASRHLFNEYVLRLDSDRLAAYLWMIPRLFIIDGKQLDMSDPSDKLIFKDLLQDPNQLGFSGTQKLVEWLTSFLSRHQSN
jgi:hypothetical protein